VIWLKRIGLFLIGTAIIGAGFFWYLLQYADVDFYPPLFTEHCGDCHGDDMLGTDRAIALIENRLEGGDSVAAMIHSINHKHVADGRPQFEDELTQEQIKGLAMYVGERRLGQKFEDFRAYSPIVIPDEPIHSTIHDFSIEVFANSLDPLTYSIEPLPDGSFLLTERLRGLSLISSTGVQSEPIDGTPKTGKSGIAVRGIPAGLGWLLDVAVHPDYEQNGWIYLHYTDLCTDNCEHGSRLFPASMNRLERGRIKDGRWVDVETLWQAEPQFYTRMIDTTAGGRIAFDDAGHVYFSVGWKEPLALSSQDLNSPNGKIHRINDDGSIPANNPFLIHPAVGNDESTLTRQSIWTYGHRTPQGLEWNPRRGKVWNTEMGPRGGDEINELLPGRNYGWPYHSLGLEYTGHSVARYKLQDIEFDTSKVEQTLVDFTPSPALSSFAFYQGDKFPGWRGNLLLGTLKGSSLYRLVFDGKEMIEREVLFRDLARIRDVEIGYDGLVYLLLENAEESMIVRLVPTD
jgi:aldose sugar dehydrogenase